MHRTPLDIRRCRLPVNGVAEHVKHPRENGLAHRRFQRPARVREHHAARQPLRGRQRNPAHMPRIALRQHFDDNFVFSARTQHRVNRRQWPIKSHIHNAAAHRGDRAEICCASLMVHGFWIGWVNSKIHDANNSLVASSC